MNIKPISFAGNYTIKVNTGNKNTVLGDSSIPEDVKEEMRNFPPTHIARYVIGQKLREIAVSNPRICSIPETFEATIYAENVEDNTISIVTNGTDLDDYRFLSGIFLTLTQKTPNQMAKSLKEASTKVDFTI